MRVHRKSFPYGDHTVTLETGRLARQATGSVLVDVDGTTVLVTVVANKKALPSVDMVPLSVFYIEKMSAGGRIPGGFFKREGRPSEIETLISRLIDRPLRPLLADNFNHEIQIIATLYSLNPEVNPDIPALIGASAALMLAGLPFKGPVAAARVGYLDGELVLNPTQTEMTVSDLDLVIAGTDTSVMMVESGARELPDEVMLEAIMFGHGHMQVAIEAVKELVAEAGVKPFKWVPDNSAAGIVEALRGPYSAKLDQAYRIATKRERQERLTEVHQEAVAAWKNDGANGAPVVTESTIIRALGVIESELVRGRILNGEPRIDGRGTETIRPVSAETRVFSRTHGDALFNRGETQALVMATIGTMRDAQVLDTAQGERKETFMLHYNFPPYSVGETGPVGSPKRREIGHGRLAKRAIEAVLPDLKTFPYVIRVISDITACNGSSSMATVCGASMALMDAGIPLKSSVAGIAMGLVLEDDRFAILSDIMGDEDHLGDMDFKVAGTKRGVTALQMDIKVGGITKEVLEAALAQAKTGRLHILSIMDQVISGPRQELSEFAPRIVSLKINPEKIREVIGKGGATIRGLTEEFGVNIDITDEGQINIVASDQQKAQAVKARIEQMTAEVEVGRVYEGPVARIMEYGAFITLLPGRDGLLHVSQISDSHVDDVSTILAVGQVVRVKVLEIDRQNRIRLSMKGLDVVVGDAPAEDEFE
ncbi:MAG: polyribonucleotide nucleotidyltransferase [Pseudomonadota bacterium]